MHTYARLTLMHFFTQAYFQMSFSVLNLWSLGGNLAHFLSFLLQLGCIMSVQTYTREMLEPVCSDHFQTQMSLSSEIMGLRVIFYQLSLELGTISGQMVVQSCPRQALMWFKFKALSNLGTFRHSFC